MSPKDGGTEYDRPIEIADHVYWVGFQERRSNLRCHPYLIREGDQALLIDAGSRPDFAMIMMKILQTGISPERISTLIYHHYDPDLCGSLPNMVDISQNPKLIVLSEPNNNTFLTYYIERQKRGLLQSIDEYGLEYRFGERLLRFIKTPYAHSPGSFVTYDAKTKTLFSSDLFGSESHPWELFLTLEEECYACGGDQPCVLQKEDCALQDILTFHKRIMPSGKSLRHAIRTIRDLDIEMIAPQHGTILNKKREIGFLMEKLSDLQGVGIDAYS